MTTAISEIKQELATLPAKKLLELCLELARYKKDNKELMSYLLFDADNPAGFIENVKQEIETHFAELPKANRYLTKKSLRKLLRTINKYIRFTGKGEPAIEMLIYFCTRLKDSSIPVRKDQALLNLYTQQLKKIEVLIASLHEDLHYDYKKHLDRLHIL